MINNSLVNAFNNPERSIVLDCVTARGHENAIWEVQSSFANVNTSYYAITIYNLYLSTITIIDPGVNVSVTLKCKSDTSKQYRIVTVTAGMCMLISNLCACVNTILYYIYSRKPISEVAQCCQHRNFSW